MVVVCFFYRFHICTWQTVNRLVNECEAGGGDRILLCVNCFFLLIYCVYMYTCTYTHVYVCMYVCVRACVNFVTCFVLYVVVFWCVFFPSLTPPACGLRSSRLIEFCSLLFYSAV